MLQCKITTSQSGVDSIELVPCSQVQNPNPSHQSQKTASDNFVEEEMPLLSVQESATRQKYVNNHGGNLKQENKSGQVKTANLVAINGAEKELSASPKKVVIKQDPKSSQTRVLVSPKQTQDKDKNSSESML